MFFVSLHSTGGSPWGATPLWSGPRQLGQNFIPSSPLSFPAMTAIPNPTTAADTTIRARFTMGSPL
jgi:hypothetical protein